MLQNAQNPRQRWKEVDLLINRWLEERQELLVRFCAISRVRPISEAADKHQLHFHRFSEVLVDYISAGHFEIYEQLIQEGLEFQDGSVELARQLYPVIEKTTEVVLDFNDKCVDNGDTRTLARDLSQLGEALEARFEAEDRLIEALHKGHEHLVA